MPYQLHCEPPVVHACEEALERTELATEEFVIELTTELELTLEQTLPVIVGFSAEELLFLLP